MSTRERAIEVVAEALRAQEPWSWPSVVVDRLVAAGLLTVDEAERPRTVAYCTHTSSRLHSTCTRPPASAGSAPSGGEGSG